LAISKFSTAMTNQLDLSVEAENLMQFSENFDGWFQIYSLQER